MTPRFEVVEVLSPFPGRNFETRWHVKHVPSRSDAQLWSIAHTFDTEFEAYMKCAVWNSMGWLRYRWFVFVNIKRWGM